MLSVHTMPELKLNSGRRWEIILWLGRAFDYSVPFRATLEEIAALLNGSLDLPPYEEGEDFIEGDLTFEQTVLGIYFEYSLGYLSLTHDDHHVMEAVAAKVLPRVRLRARP